MGLVEEALTEESVINFATVVKWAIVGAATLTMAWAGNLYLAYQNAQAVERNAEAIQQLEIQARETNDLVQRLVTNQAAHENQTSTYQEGAIRLDDNQSREIQQNTNRIDQLYRQN